MPEVFIATMPYDNISKIYLSAIDSIFRKLMTIILVLLPEYRVPCYRIFKKNLVPYGPK